MPVKFTATLRKLLMTSVLTTVPFISNAADGTINFTGKILDAACTIDTSTESQTVNLGNIPKKFLQCCR